MLKCEVFCAVLDFAHQADFYCSITMAYRQRTGKLPMCAMCDQIGHTAHDCREPVFGGFKPFGPVCAMSFRNGFCAPVPCIRDGVPGDMMNSIIRNARRANNMPFVVAFMAFTCFEEGTTVLLPGRTSFKVPDRRRFPFYYMDMEMFIPKGAPGRHALFVVGCELKDAPELVRILVDYYIANGSVESRGTVSKDGVPMQGFPVIWDAEGFHDLWDEGDLFCNNKPLLEELVSDYVFTLPTGIAYREAKEAKDAKAAMEAADAAAAAPSSTLETVIQDENLVDAVPSATGVSTSVRKFWFGDFTDAEATQFLNGADAVVKLSLRVRNM